MVGKPIDPSAFSGALREAVKEALEMGWTAKRGKSGFKLRSPGGSKWMHVTPSTNIPDYEARNLRSKIRRAFLDENQPDVLEALDDPQEHGVTVECKLCHVEFLTWDGFAAHQEECNKAHSAPPAADEDPEEGIVQPEGVEPSEGRTEAPAPEVSKPNMSVGFDTISNKEEDVTETNNSARGGYTWNVVKPGLARALYTAMKSRSQHKGEATSTYANVIAGMVEEAGIDFGYVPATDEAQAKILKIVEILGVDPMAQTEVETLREDNDRLVGQLKTLKELLSDL